MELAPQSAKSPPKSPFRFPNPQTLYDYPSPARSDSRYRSTDSIHGLGLYTDAMTGSTIENSGLGTQDQSTATTNTNWPPLQLRNTPASSTSTPNILSADDTLILSPPALGHSLLVTPAYPGSLDATYYHNPASMGWSKVEYSNGQELPSISSLPIPQYDRRSESQERISVSSHDQRRSSSAVARTRQPRRLTTKEDANFQCHVKGCGKLFGRSYNYKAHLETHDSTREYPFPCLVKDCTKKFVRKTDLQRHHQSVHMKQRNYRCDYCSRHFARKDTLRRHMEDGCSKRFDIETVDFRPQSFGDNNALKISSQQTNSPSRHPAYGSSTHYSTPLNNSTSHAPSNRSLPSSSGPFLQRQDYMTGGWSN